MILALAAAITCTMAFKLGTDPPVLEEEACWLEKLEVESNQMVNIGQQHGQKKKKEWQLQT